MGKTYSEDLRLRVLWALDSGMSKLAVCRAYKLARTTLDDWLRLREQTGSLRPKSYQRGRAPQLPDTAQVHHFIQRHSHCTLSQMSQAWEKETGQKVSVVTFCNRLRRLGYTRKKRVISTANVTPSNARFFWSRSL